jgi:hypothetical protein
MAEKVIIGVHSKALVVFTGLQWASQKAYVYFRSFFYHKNVIRKFPYHKNVIVKFHIFSLSQNHKFVRKRDVKSFPNYPLISDTYTIQDSPSKFK